MDHRVNLCSETWTDSSLGNETSQSSSLVGQQFAHSDAEQLHQKWDNSAAIDNRNMIKPNFSEIRKPSESVSSHLYNPGNQTQDSQDGQAKEMLHAAIGLQDWDARAVLLNLSFLEQKIHQLQDLVHLIIGQDDCVLGRSEELAAQRKQLVYADLTSLIVQLISTAGSLLPSVKNSLSASNPFLGHPQNVCVVPNLTTNDATLPQDNGGSKVHSHSTQQTEPTPQHNYAGKPPSLSFSNIEEHHESKDDEDAGEGENLLPGSYVVLQLEKDEILAPHTHFCLICGKGFKRDANLRMHMRGHGDEYKTPAALAKPLPNKESSSEPMLLKRYSCPYVGCKRNKDHKKFQPLKTILCVKNHYKRTHCDKSYTCSRCNTKKFSVIADLKTHEKHCGRDKWLCSCGTTFSRKDKLFGHVALFQGHSPALPVDETKMDVVESNEETLTKVPNSRVTEVQDTIGMKGCLDDPSSYFSPLDFDTYNFGGFHDFSRPPFDQPQSPLSSCLLSKSSSFMQKTTSASSSDAML